MTARSSSRLKNLLLSTSLLSAAIFSTFCGMQEAAVAAEADLFVQPSGSAPIAARTDTIGDLFAHALKLSTVIINTPVTATGVFASGACIGPLQTLGGVNRTGASPATGGVVDSITIADQNNLQIPIDLIFFNAGLASTCTDNTAFNVAVGDLSAGKLQGVVHFLATDYTLLGTGGTVAAKAGIGLRYNTLGSLFAIMVFRGAATTTVANGYTINYRLNLD